MKNLICASQDLFTVTILTLYFGDTFTYAIRLSIPLVSAQFLSNWKLSSMLLLKSIHNFDTLFGVVRSGITVEYSSRVFITGETSYRQK